MTALEATINELEHLRKLALFSGRSEDYAALGKLLAGCWPTVRHALEELDRRRIV